MARRDFPNAGRIGIDPDQEIGDRLKEWKDHRNAGSRGRRARDEFNKVRGGGAIYHSRIYTMR
jgi:hypothetical protein